MVWLKIESKAAVQFRSNIDKDSVLAPSHGNDIFRSERMWSLVEAKDKFPCNHVSQLVTPILQL